MSAMQGVCAGLAAAAAEPAKLLLDVLQDLQMQA